MHDRGLLEMSRHKEIKSEFDVMQLSGSKNTLNLHYKLKIFLPLTNNNLNDLNKMEHQFTLKFPFHD